MKINNYIQFLWLIALQLCCMQVFSAQSDILTYPINSPYSKKDAIEKIMFGSFSEQPKHLDPAKSYSTNESQIISQICEPLYEYHYLIRPYKLVPLIARDYINVDYFDVNNKKLPNNTPANKVKYSVYTIKIKQNIFYQPHPGLARDKNGKFIYHDLSLNFIKKVHSINQFDLTKLNINYTRELVANDFIYAIKRLADPKIGSPIYSFMANHIIGLDKLNKTLSSLNSGDKYINLNDYDIDGLKLIDKYTLQIKIKNKYPQFKYWFAMTFFAPIPWEVDEFYSQPGFAKQNISFDTYPIGTGAYMLMLNNPNQKIELVKNPNYKHGFYPTNGMPEDFENKLLEKSGMPIPFIEKNILFLEKESLPIWNKFIQGYYDTAGISSDNFDQAINIVNNKPELSKEMLDKNIKLVKSTEPSIYYWGFNMLDPVVGGYTKKQKKLRQAIGIAMDVEEYISIFMNGRGKVAHGPIPPIILEVKEFNNYLYNDSNHKKTIDDAKKLLAEAGYPNGVDPTTGQQLVINFDVAETGSSNDNALFNWLVEQFKKININLNIRSTQYNKFQEKIREGQGQMFYWGWVADYPDPENFLFLFLCNQAKVKYNGENTANYCNQEYEDLYKKMQDEEIEINKNIIINKMIKILREDAPWLFGVYNELFILQHAWNAPSKLSNFGNNILKYRSINTKLRVEQQSKWNQPVLWPFFVFLLVFIGIFLPIIVIYYKKTHQSPDRIN